MQFNAARLNQFIRVIVQTSACHSTDTAAAPLTAHDDRQLYSDHLPLTPVYCRIISISPFSLPPSLWVSVSRQPLPLQCTADWMAIQCRVI